ncbi:MAG: hypothetical protein QOF58_3999 [Pseudonocardiales bacterium]|jgi:hypothetical protein|nr:hypothetical protein [Pseudonocardiales bacterium]
MILVRVVFRSGVPTAPLQIDPPALFVSLDEPLPRDTQAACNLLYRPISEYMDTVYGTGGFGGLGPVSGLTFDGGFASGHVTLRHRVALCFYYEQLPESVTSPADWLQVDHERGYDFTGLAAPNPAAPRPRRDAPIITSRRIPVLMAGTEYGAVEILRNGTINALWFSEFCEELVVEALDCHSMGRAVVALVRRHDQVRANFGRATA